MARTVDAIVIGSGQGGMPLAFWLAENGASTALIESRAVGGTCVNYGCTPTKTMVASARVAHVVDRAPDYGVYPGSSAGEASNKPLEYSVDLRMVRERKRNIVSSFRGSSEGAIEDAENLELIRGEAVFSGARTIVVRGESGEQELTAEKIFINTGTRPAVPPIDGLETVHYLTNETIMELAEVPEHLVIIGGGYIGVEFGQMFRRFGSRVTILQRSGQLLPREDEDVAGEIADILEEDGVEVLLNAEATEARGGPEGVQLTVDADGASRTLRGSHLLVAVGRTPNTDMLNLRAAGVSLRRRGTIEVDDRLETGVEGIWALGDVTGGPAFTHISYDDFRIIRTNLQGGAASTRGRLVPYTVFMDPQLGRVGMTEKAARESGRSIKVASLPMSSVARALETDETRGLMKAVVDADSDGILGFAMLGIQGGEIAGAIQVAMLGDLPYTVLRDAPFAHPTLMESLNNLFSTL